MALTNQQKAKLAGMATAVAGIIGLVAVESIDYSTAVTGSLSDGGFLSSSQGGTVADILGEIVAPGATASTLISFVGGSSGFDVVAPANFTINSTAVKQLPGPPGQPSITTLTITYTNNATDAKRFVGFVSFIPPPTGG